MSKFEFFRSSCPSRSSWRVLVSNVLNDWNIWNKWNSHSPVTFARIRHRTILHRRDPARLRRNEKKNLTAKNLARRSRNRNSDYLAQRRKGRKGRKITVKQFFKIIHIFPLNLACFAAWRESIPVFEYSDSRKFARAVQTFKHSRA